MRSIKTCLLVLFVLTTAATAVLAWRQHRELISLRAAVLAQEIELKSRAASPTPAPASLVPAEQSPETALAPEAQPAFSEPGQPAAFGPPEPMRPARGEFSRAAFMDNPEVQRLMTMQRKASLDGRYAALFKSLNLPPDQLDRLKELLVERINVRSDVMSAARSQGSNFREDRDAISALVNSGEAEVDAAIRSTLGESVYSQWQDYERTMPQRNTINRLEQRLSYTSTPLSREQSAAMLQILSRSDPTAGNSRRGGVVDDRDFEQARGVLAAPQLDALRQLQDEQRAQADISAAMQRQFRRNRGDAPAQNQPAGRTGG